MNPFYFGSGARRIFGIYEPPTAGGKATRAAVLCHPCGEEYLYAHRAMRQLAIKLSQAGFHTLRFDYFGTGDSAGEMTDPDLESCRSDVGLAIAEMQDMAGVPAVSLIGLRLGGTIAATAATKFGQDIDALVLWDPILSAENDQHRLGTEQARLISAPSKSTLMLITERLPLHGSLSPVPRGQGPGSLEIEFMPDVHPWIEDSANSGMLPIGAIQRIADWLE